MRYTQDPLINHQWGIDTVADKFNQIHILIDWYYIGITTCIGDTLPFLFPSDGGNPILAVSHQITLAIQ